MSRRRVRVSFVDVRVDQARLTALRRLCLIATDGITSRENGNWLAVERAIDAYLHARRRERQAYRYIRTGRW